MWFCFEALKSTKINSYEPISSQKHEIFFLIFFINTTTQIQKRTKVLKIQSQSTKMGTRRKFVTLQYQAASVDNVTAEIFLCY